MNNLAIAILEDLEAGGLTLSLLDAGRLHIAPRERLTPEARELILVHKADICCELRRRQAIAMLEADPGLQRAYIVMDDDDPERVLVTAAVRGAGSCDIAIPRAQWDPLLFLQFLETRLR